jgi:hypothetical protein
MYKWNHCELRLGSIYLLKMSISVCEMKKRIRASAV